MPHAPEPAFPKPPPTSKPPKVPKFYRGTTTLVSKYLRMSREEQAALNAECDEKLTFTEETDPTTGRPVVVGRNKKA
jgi:hypothetical protein